MGLITITIGLSTIVTLISLLVKYRKQIRGIFMTSEDKIQKGMIKKAMKLLHIRLSEHVDKLVKSGNPQKVLSFLQEINERYKLPEAGEPS